MLLVRLINTLKKEFKNFYDILNFYLWTDSSVAYSWIVNTSKVFPVFIQNRVKEIGNLVDTACFKLIDIKRNPADIISRGVKPVELRSNKLWFSGPEFLTLDKHSWPSLKVGGKFILLSGIESRGNDVCMCDVICKEVEKNKDNDACMCDVIDKENGNDCMCAFAINTEANIENNLQLESFSSLFKLFRVTAFVYKFVEKVKCKVKIKIK